MRTPYERAMDHLFLDAEQKQSLANNLKAALEAEENPSHPKTVSPRAVRPRSRRLACALAVAAALVIGTSGLAVASGLGEGGLKSLLQHLFGGSPADPDTVSQLGSAQSVSTTNNGVTASLEAIIGDDHNLYLLLAFTDELKTGFGLGSDEGPACVSLTACTIDGASPDSPLIPESWTSRALLGDEESANTAYVVVSSTLAEGSWPGQDVVLTIESLQAWGTYSPEHELRGIPIDGPWVLKFAVDRGDVGREIPGGQTLQVGKSQLVIGSIYLSPIGLDIVFPVTTEAVESGAVVAPFVSTLDLMQTPVTLTLSDGTTFGLNVGAEASNGSVSDDLYNGKVWLTARPDRLIDPNEVISIAIGDQLEIAVPHER